MNKQSISEKKNILQVVTGVKSEIYKNWKYQIFLSVLISLDIHQ